MKVCLCAITSLHALECPCLLNAKQYVDDLCSIVNCYVQASMMHMSRNQHINHAGLLLSACMA